LAIRDHRRAEAGAVRQCHLAIKAPAVFVPAMTAHLAEVARLDQRRLRERKGRLPSIRAQLRCIDAEDAAGQSRLAGEANRRDQMIEAEINIKQQRVAVDDADATGRIGAEDSAHERSLERVPIASKPWLNTTE